MRADTAALNALPDIMPAPRAWDALQARLEGEGLLRVSPAQVRARHRWSGALARLAAVVAYVGLGTAVGAYALAPRLAPAPTQLAAAPTHGEPATATPAEAAAVPAAAAQPEQHERLADHVAPPPFVRSAPGGPGGGIRLASNDYAPRIPASAEEALAALREAESGYLDALTRYAELAGGAPGGDPMARLAALEGIVLTTRAALGQAPADPVINGYHMTALAHRDATLRQLAASSVQSWF
jgi:hypothetical protein